MHIIYRNITLQQVEAPTMVNQASSVMDEDETSEQQIEPVPKISWPELSQSLRRMKARLFAKRQSTPVQYEMTGNYSEASPERSAIALYDILNFELDNNIMQ